MKRLLLHFARFGPYHVARLKSACESLSSLGWQVHGLQVCSSDATYAWEDPTSDESLLAAGLPTGCIETLFPGRVYELISSAEIRGAMESALGRLNPDGIAIAGWASQDALACLSWCRRHDRTAILMSETRAVDGTRRWWKEVIKVRRVRRFDAAIVGAASHAEYLQRLGMPRSRIRMGYNVVDNVFFRDALEREREGGGQFLDVSTEASGQMAHDRAVNESSDRLGERRPFLLASNRFVEIKNLHRAIEAFAGVCENSQMDLCLLGDGPLRTSLIDHARALGMNVVEARPWDDRRPESFKSVGPDFEPGVVHREGKKCHPGNADLSGATVYFPGFQQIDALPAYYARAAAFFHPATSEPWGLVINEAMASGLPILASQNGGAAETLVVPGENGILFDPSDVDEMAAAIRKFSRMPPEDQRRWGRRSRELLEERAPTSAFGTALRQLLETDR